jgi:acyl-CoA reductase-like NAD-dependent aldehyde dehydrogenase
VRPPSNRLFKPKPAEGPNISYGGYKQSGLGRELTLESMLEHFTVGKSIIINFE